jgi:cation-transporting ATPase I
MRVPSIVNPVKPFREILDNLNKVGRSRRRIWRGSNRLHIEVKGVDQPDKQELIQDLKNALLKLKNVDWVEINSVVGRAVIAATEGEDLQTEDVLGVIEEVEKLHRVHSNKFPHERPEHPGDSEPFSRNLVALASDIAGIVGGFMGLAIRATPIPGELASLVTLIDSEPRLRRILENRFGHPATDLGLAILNAIGQGLSQGPLGLIVDSVHRINSLVEVKSRQNIWQRKEPQLAGKLGKSNVGPPIDQTRITPLPSGYIEKYADIASLSSVGAFGVTFAISKSPRKSANLLAAALPKAARLGREAFSAHLDRILASKGALVMNSLALRKLDRVDTVVFDAKIFLTGRWQLNFVQAINPKDQKLAEKTVANLFDPFNLVKRQSRFRFKLNLASEQNLSKELLRKVNKLKKGKTQVLLLLKRDECIAVATAIPEIDANAPILVNEATQAGFNAVIAGKGSGVAEILGIKTVVSAGNQLGGSIRQLQDQGKVVMLIFEAEKNSALKASDVSIGIYREHGDVPWGADIIVDPAMDQLFTLIKAVKVAKSTSKISVQFALAGSVVAGIWTMLGPSSTAAQRATVPVNIAALLSQGNGVLQALKLENLNIPRPVNETPWHSMENSVVLKTLETSINGLSEKEANKRLSATKISTPIESQKFVKGFISELVNPMTPLLAIGASLSAAVGSVTDAALVGGVTLANALIGSTQRLRTDRSVKRLKQNAMTTVTVIRDGRKVEKGQDEIVIGDIVELKDGDVVPADIRLIKSDNLEIDESSLTGESIPIYKESEPSNSLSVMDRSCMVYEGSTVVAGEGLGVVVACGSDTESSKALNDTNEKPQGGVEARLNNLMRTLMPFTILSGSAVSGISLLRRRPITQAITSGVSLMVAAVPEGLPMLANLAQLASAERLSSRGALVKNPKTIEALGRGVTVNVFLDICAIT